MPQSGQPCLIAEQLGCEVANERSLFKNISLSVFPGDRIALVGKNGVGKSTLLQCLARQRQPTQGKVSSQASVVYVSQLSSLKKIAQKQSVLEFLSAVTDAWWEVEHCLDSLFNTVLDLSSPTHCLSGGEMMQLSLAISLWRKPDLLLLDEPTNHLDYLALEQLRQALSQFKGAFIIVSHKPFFLDQVVDMTWELTPVGLRVYGGNYSFYRERRQMERKAAERSHETARKELKRTKATILKEQKRAAQSSRKGRQQFLAGGIPRIVAGGLQRSAEQIAGKLKTKHEAAVTAATKKMAETKVSVHKATSVQLSAKSQKHRNLIEVSHADLWMGERVLVRDVSLRMVSGDRIAIAGPNGSGKSSLIKAILGLDTAAVFKTGDIQLADMQTVYLDQRYELIDRSQTVLENMHSANSTLAYQLLRQQLGHFLFFNDDVYKPAAVLSGGELARLAIAMITISELDLLILDEPTNNLDIETVNQIINGLSQYQGALCVISHDLYFLSRIRIVQSLRLLNASLQQTTYLPNDKSDYYDELLGRF